MFEGIQLNPPLIRESKLDELRSSQVNMHIDKQQLQKLTEII